MTPRNFHHRSPRWRGYTLLEFVVAMVVLGIAMSGLFPLLVVLSRDLQPLKEEVSGNVAYQCRTPARDGNTTGNNLAYTQHTWYLTPYNDPWVRKLGPGALITPAPMTSASPLPLSPPVLQQDDYDDNQTPADGPGTYTDSGDWTYNGSVPQALLGDDHTHIALPAGTTPTSFAVWTLQVVNSGWYAIQATWPPSNNQATDAVYTVLQNGAPLPTVASVNQQNAPVGVTDTNGRQWAQLTPALVQLNANDTVQVQLSDVRANSSQTGQYVVADGVRIVQNEVQIKSVERSLSGPNSNSNNADVTVHVSVTVNLSQ